MRTLKSALAITPVLFLVSCGQPPAKVDLHKSRIDVQKANDEIVTATIEGDTDAIYAHYADDAVSMPNFGPMLKGKEAIIGYDRESRAAGFQTHALKLTTLEVWACGNLVYEIGRYWTSVSLPGASQPVQDDGKYMVVWLRQPDGSLKVKAEIWNTDTDPLAEG